MRKKNQKSTSPSGPSKEPKTMAELMAKTGYKIHGFKKGEVVEGVISFLSPKEILIDIGGKTEGSVARKELPILKDLISSFKIGEKVLVRILLPEGEQGRPLLSLKEAVSQKKWQDLKEKQEKGEEIEVLGKNITRGGVLVEYQGLRGFIPQTQLDPEFLPKPKNLLGRKIKVKILEVKKEINRIILSQKAVSQKAKLEKIKKILKKIKVGQSLEVEVANIAPFGLFVKTKNGLEGLVHISEIAWEKVENPAEYFKIGDKIKAKVLGVEEREERLNLSIKRLTPDPWEGIEKRYKKEQIVKGKVVRVSSYGAFISLEKGIEGLLHVSKIPVGVEIKKAQKIECVIEKIDIKGRRISLSYLPKEKPVGYR